MNKFEELKRSLFVGTVMYRKEIRKKLLKIIVVLNGVLFFIAIMNNQPSMILFLLNMYYLFNYMKSEYPETTLKSKDRFKDLDK